MKKRLTQNAQNQLGKTLRIRWGVSVGQDTYGYTTCSLSVDGKRQAACNGGGYDMKGTVIGSWIARTFSKELCALKPADFPESRGQRELYGLTFHDPNYDPGKAVIGEGCDDRTLGEKGKDKTVAQAEADGDSFGLERYQAVYKASSPVPTKRHTIPSIDGACGLSSVLAIFHAIGLDLRQVVNTSKLDVYEVVKV